MIFDDVGGKEPIINECFCRGRHSNCNMMYLNQKIFSADRKLEKILIYLFSLNKEVEPQLYIKISLEE